MSDSYSQDMSQQPSWGLLIGWGSNGPAKLPPAIGVFGRQSLNPQGWHPPGRVVNGFVANIPAWGFPNSTGLLIGQNGTCRLDRWQHTVFNNYPEQDIPRGVVTVLPSVPCTDESMVFVGQLDLRNDVVYDYLIIDIDNMDWAGTINRAIAYIGQGFITQTGGSPPTYTPVDITSILQANNVQIHAPGTFVAFADTNYDGLADMYILSSAGSKQQLLLFYGNQNNGPWGIDPTPVIAINDLGFRTPIASANQGAPFPTSCQSGVSRGPSGMMLWDLDGDGVHDVVVAGPSDQNIHFFHGTNSGEFIRGNDIIFPLGGGQFFETNDYDKDFFQDLAVGRGEHACGNGNIGAAVLYGQRSTGYFRQHPLFLTANSNTLRWMNSPYRYVYDTPSHYYTSSADVFTGTRGNPMFGTQWFNVPVLDRYNAFGQATTPTVTAGGQALISGYINMPTSQPSGTSINAWVSPDNQEHWEPISPQEMTGSTPHQFYNYGNQLVFRVEMRAPQSYETGSYAQNMPCATVSPVLSPFSMNITGLSQQANFTRSNIVGATLGSGNSNRPITLSARYMFPNWEGHLLAYDLHTGDSASSNTVVNTTAKLLWDAGALLQNRSGSSRIIYTSYVNSTLSSSPNLTVNSLTRLNFNQGEVNSPSTPPGVVPLRTALGWPPPFANNMARGFLGGNNGSASSGPKMYDTGHGDPVFVAAPSQDANVMGSNYKTFATKQAGREGIILKSSNAGMLHAFDANSGSELWGFVPHAQLQRIGDTSVYDLSNYTSYRHHLLVDGPTISGDVYSQGAWHTIAIQGQGFGWSDSNNNFYFALDITNPTQPQPLWEITEPMRSGQLTCDYNNMCKQLSCSQTLPANANCVLQNGTYNSYFAINPTMRDENGQPYGATQAEFVSMITPATDGSNGSWSTPSSTSSAKGSSAHNNSYLQAGGTSNTCNASSAQSGQSCSRAEYMFTVDPSTTGNYYVLLRQWYDGKSHQVSVLVDDNLVFAGSPSLFTTGMNSWRWGSAGSASLSAGQHKLSLLMTDPTIAIDAFALRVNGGSAPQTGATTTSINNCDQQGTSPPCANTCLNPSQEWPECGVGANLKCCANGGQSFCAPVGASCSQPPSAMGQTFSKPALARLKTSGGDVWAAIFASGYNVSNAVNVGRSVYAVEALTGKPLGEWNLPDVSNPPTGALPTAVAGGFALVDADNDGYIDRIYFGDTAGRLWKLNTYNLGNASAVNGLNSSYSTCVVFDAGDPNGSGTRIFAPITQTPAVAVVDKTTPNIYFGTGSAPGASQGQQYTFYSIRDSDAMGACTNTSKHVANFSTANLEWFVTDPSRGFRFWGDPTVVDNAMVFFSSMYGDPDWLSSADNTSLQSHVYARAIQSFVDNAGVSHTAASSTLSGGYNYLTAAGGVRSALVSASAVGGSTSGTSGANTVARGNQGISGTPLTNMYVNNLAGDVLRITTGGTQAKLNRLRRIGWREIVLPSRQLGQTGG